MTWWLVEGEEVNANLETELEKLQRDTDMLLVKITELRRSCPEMIRERFHLTVEDLERAMPGVAPHLAPLPVSLNITEADIDALVGELERLQKLNKVLRLLSWRVQLANRLCCPGFFLEYSRAGFKIAKSQNSYKWCSGYGWKCSTEYHLGPIS